MRSSWMNTPVYELFLPASYVERLRTCNQNELVCGLEHLFVDLAIFTGFTIVSGLVFVVMIYVTELVPRALKRCNFLKLAEVLNRDTILTLFVLMLGVAGLIVILTVGDDLPSLTPGIQSKSWPPTLSPFRW